MKRAICVNEFLIWECRNQGGFCGWGLRKNGEIIEECLGKDELNLLLQKEGKPEDIYKCDYGYAGILTVDEGDLFGWGLYTPGMDLNKYLEKYCVEVWYREYIMGKPEIAPGIANPFYEEKKPCPR
jgi:hypothetical protein